MSDITLDNKPFVFDESFLPCIITGAEGSGASNFSIALVASLINRQIKVIFFTAFPMAKENLFAQIGKDNVQLINGKNDLHSISEDSSLVVKSGDVSLLKQLVSEINNIEEYILFIKNIEEYDDGVLAKFCEFNKIILSGSIDECSYKDQLTKMNWGSKVEFNAPQLLKYEAYLESKYLNGVLRLKQ
jgi:hypothetical protein